MTAPTCQVELKAMGELSAHALYALLKLRVDVFVVEQKCPYPELDGKDDVALHLMLKEGDELLAAARLFAPHDGIPAKIGRVVVSPAHRGKKLGDALMREAIKACESRFPGTDIFLSAQSYLKEFYKGFGFSAISGEYVEDGIPHIDMLRKT